MASSPESDISERVVSMVFDDEFDADYLSSLDSDFDGDIPVPDSSLIVELTSQFTRLENDKNRNLRHKCKFCSSITIGNTNRRLIAHIKKCRVMSQELKKELKQIMLDKGSKTSFDTLDLQWSEILIAHGIPFNFSNSEQLKNFFMKNFLPKWGPPNATKISAEYVPEIAKKTRENMNLLIKQAADWSISVEFDHADLGSKSVLAIILTFQCGNRYLIALEDSSSSKTAEAVSNSLKTRLSDLPKLKINSFVSDSARNCKKARDDMCKISEYKHCVSHRCIAHLLNLVIKRIKNERGISELIDRAKSATEVLSKRKDLQKLLQQSGVKRVEQACETRWHILTNMLCSLLAAKDSLVEIITPSDNAASGIYDLVRDDLFWSEIDELLDLVLVPLTYCIAQAEERNGTIGKAFKLVLDLFKQLYNADWNKPVIVIAFKSLLHHFSGSYLSADEFGLYLASYCMDKRYKLDYVALAVRKIAIKSGFTKTYIDVMLPEELGEFVSQTKFSEPVRSNEKPSEWWSNQPNSGILRTVALRLVMMKSSSSNVERTFSLMKAMMGSNRDSLSFDSLEDISTVKVSLLPTVDEIRASYNSDDEIEVASSSQTSTLSASSNTNSAISVINDTRMRVLGSTAREEFKKFLEIFDFNIINVLTNCEKRVASDDSGDEESFINRAKAARTRL